jgi:hypothetical protein
MLNIYLVLAKPDDGCREHKIILISIQLGNSTQNGYIGRYKEKVIIIIMYP